MQNASSGPVSDPLYLDNKGTTAMKKARKCRQGQLEELGQHSMFACEVFESSIGKPQSFLRAIRIV